MTSNFQVDNLLKPLLGPYYGGCVKKDDLINMKPDNKFWVINIGESTHWIGVIDFDSKYCYYYDSYGLSPPDEIIKFMSKSNKNKQLYYQNIEHQTLQSDLCGEFVCFVFIQFFKGIPFKTITEKILTTDYKSNENLVTGIIDRNSDF